MTKRTLRFQSIFITFVENKLHSANEEQAPFALACTIFAKVVADSSESYKSKRKPGFPKHPKGLYKNRIL